MNNEQMRGVIAGGWIVIMFISIVMLIFWLFGQVIAGDFTRLTEEFGAPSSEIKAAIFLAVQIIIPIVVKSADHPAIRWAVFGVTGLRAVLIIVDLISWNHPSRALFALSSTMCVITIYIGIISFLWARRKPAEV